MTETRKRYYYKPGGYETDHLIDDLSDDQLLAHMGVPRKYIANASDMVEEDLPVKILEWMEDLPYIFRPSDENLRAGMCGVGLILSGPGATRKTTIAASTLLRVVRKKIPNTDPSGHNYTWHGALMGRFVDWQRASALFRSANSNEDDAVTAEEIRTAMLPSGPVTTRADILLLDDISRERPTEYNTGELHRILRDRSDEGYPTIITTNHSRDEWVDQYGEVLAAYIARSHFLVEFE